MGKIILEVSDEVAEKFEALSDDKKNSFRKFIEVFLEEIEVKK